MRTHLFKTVYASRAVEAIEPDIGRAANDRDYFSTLASTVITKQVSAITRVMSGPTPRKNMNDDYYLGGYVGI